jgi:hypothetical protein
LPEEIEFGKQLKKRATQGMLSLSFFAPVLQPQGVARKLKKAAHSSSLQLNERRRLTSLPTPHVVYLPWHTSGVAFFG